MRLKFITISQLIETSSRLMLNYIFIALHIFMGFFFYQLAFRSISPSFWPIVLLDQMLFTYLIIRLVVLALMLAWCSLIASQIYCGIIQQAGRDLTRWIQTRTQSWNPRTYLETHCRISRILLFVNRQLWGSVLLISLSTHIPSNVYLLYRICVYRILGWKLYISWTIMSIQIGIILFCLIPLARASKAVHRARRIMNPIQLALNSGGSTAVFGLKLKFLTLYERVASSNGGQKYGITIGPAKTITNRAIFQLSLIYLAYVLNVIKFFVENH